MKKIIKPYCARNMLFKKVTIDNETENNTNKNINNTVGFLDISIYDDTSNEPIQNAKVVIVEVTLQGLYDEKGKGREIYSYTTDENGKIPIISLPIDERLNIYEDTHVHYHMAITAPNYDNAYVVNLQSQIYPDITTLFKINLNVSDYDKPEFDFIITPPIERIHTIPPHVQSNG